MLKRLTAAMLSLILIMTILTALDIPVLEILDPTFDAKGSQIHVGPGWSYATIQSAINAANPGDEILIHPDTYHENIVVNESVNLIGTDVGDKIIDARGQGNSIIQIQSMNIRITDLIIKNSANLNSGIYVTTSARNTSIDNCTVSNCYHGIDVDTVFNIGIRDTNITDNSFNGLRLVDVSSGFVERNVFHNNSQDGIFISSGANAITVEDNTINENGGNGGNGIYLRDASNIQVIHNTINGNGNNGINLYNSTQIAMQRNTCESNSNNGIKVDRGGNNNLDNNMCDDNGHASGWGCGISLERTSQNALNYNRVNNNKNHGLKIGDWQAYTFENRAENNTCQNNGEHGIQVERSNRSVIKNNNCSYNNNQGSHGIHLDSSSAGFIEENEVMSNGDEWGDGIYLSGGSQRNQILLNTVNENAGRGIGVEESHNVTVRQNNCHGNNEQGINIGNERSPSNDTKIEWNVCMGNRGGGITLDGGKNARISNNSCKDNGNNGIQLGNGAACAIIKDNTCNGNEQHGLDLNGAPHARIIDLEVHDNTWNGVSHYDGSHDAIYTDVSSRRNGGKGMHITKSNDVQVFSSDFCENEEGGIIVNDEDGIPHNEHLTINNCDISNPNDINMVLNNMKYCNITFNNIRNSSREGITARYLEDSQFIYNFFTDNNDEGIRFENDVVHNRVFYNFFIDNRPGREEPQATDSSRTNQWDDGTEWGNYWSDYEGRHPDSLSRGGRTWLRPYELQSFNRDVFYDRFPLCSPVNRGPVYNDRTEEYNWTIEEALEAAEPHDTITILFPGYYDEENLEINVEGLYINKSTKGEVIINGSREEKGLTVKANGCMIDGIGFENHSRGVVVDGVEDFTLINSHLTNMEEAAIEIRETRDVQISKCVIYSPAYGHNCGIQIGDSEEIFINGTKIRNWDCGIQVRDSRDVSVERNDFLECGQAITFRETGESSIQENLIESCKSGIWVESNANGNYIAKNTINNHDNRPVDMIGEDASYGIMIAMGAKDNVVEENVIAECNLGIGVVLWASDNEINNNIIRQCNLAGLSFWISDLPNSASGNRIFESNVGIWINSSSNCDISQNVLRSNTMGIKIDNNTFEFDMDGSSGDDPPYLVENGSHDNVIKNNEIALGEYGIVANGGWDNHLFHNNFADNINQTQLPEGSLICEMGDIVGNYWSDYQGRDDGTGGRNAGDGMGDTDLPHGGIDFYPLMSPVEGPAYMGDMLEFLDHTDRSGAFVGRQFVFRIEVKAGELAAPDQVVIEFWYPNGMRMREPMDREEGNNWTRDLVIENSVGELHYFVRASPEDSDRWGYGPTWSLGLKDDMPPDIIIINIPETVEFGENLTFEFDVFDGAGIEDVSLEYWIGNGTRENITFTPPGPFSHTMLPDSPGILHYIIRAADEFGNGNKTEIGDVRITKDIDPADYFGEDGSQDEATTGDPFTLGIELKNVEFLKKANAMVEYDDGQPFHIVMDVRADSNRTIHVPSDATVLRYHFEVIDVYDNPHVSFEPKEISVQDNDDPVLLEDMTPVEVGSPGEIIFEVRVVDNIGVESVKVEYWFSSGGNEIIPLEAFGEKNVYRSKAVTIDNDQQKLFYTISMKDDSGNINNTGEIEVDITHGGGGGDDDDDGGDGSDTGGFFSSKGGILITAILVVLFIIIIIVIVVRKKRKRKEPVSDDRDPVKEDAVDALERSDESEDETVEKGEEPSAAAPAAMKKGRKKAGGKKKEKREARVDKPAKAPQAKADVPEEEDEDDDEGEEDYDQWDDEDAEEWSADEEDEEPPLPPPPDDFKEHLPSLTLEAASTSIKNILPGYIITDKLGAGGFATVYKAINKDGVAVAIKMPKFLDETIDSSILNKFQAEADIWKKLRHPNIVTFLDSDIRPVPFMSIELMEGGNLGGLLADHRLSVDEAKPLMLQILDGLSYAHRMASVHRDIKPENILFSRDGVPKIGDWGIGKFMASESVSQSIGTKGTFLYSAPEQFDKQNYGEVDWSTDIFQIGVVFYKMLTGINPFKADELAAVMGRILTINPEPPSSIDPEIPHDLDDIVMKCLEKKKEERWRSMDVLYNQLKQMEDKRKVNLKKYRKMLERAMADGSISQDEEAMLTEFREHMSISEREHEALIEDISGDLFVIET